MEAGQAACSPGIAGERVAGKRLTGSRALEGQGTSWEEPGAKAHQLAGGGGARAASEGVSEEGLKPVRGMKRLGDWAWKARAGRPRGRAVKAANAGEGSVNQAAGTARVERL